MLSAHTMLLNGEAAELIQALDNFDGELPDEFVTLQAWAVYRANQAESGGYSGSARIAGLGIGTAFARAMEIEWIGLSLREIIEDDAAYDEAVIVQGDVASWEPLRQFCEIQCPAAPDQCTVLGGSLLSARGPFATRSPLESVISSEMYWQSPRMAGDIARQLQDLSEFNTSRLGDLDACFVEQMAEVQMSEGTAP